MYEDVPIYIKKFLEYMSGIKNRSNATVKEYYYDLRYAFKYLKLVKKENYLDKKITKELIDNTSIIDLDLNFIKQLELTDLHKFLNFLANNNLDKPTTRARKVAALKSFFNYLTFKEKLLDKNPTVELETPKLSKRLPKLSADYIYGGILFENKAEALEYANKLLLNNGVNCSVTNMVAYWNKTIQVD